MIYLIYSCFETSNRIGGSLLLATAQTEEEAQEKLAIYKDRSDAFFKEFPCTEKSTRRLVYIPWPYELSRSQ
jgi:hypothetical protein